MVKRFNYKQVHLPDWPGVVSAYWITPLIVADWQVIIASGEGLTHLRGANCKSIRPNSNVNVTGKEELHVTFKFFRLLIENDNFRMREEADIYQFKAKRAARMRKKRL